MSENTKQLHRLIMQLVHDAVPQAPKIGDTTRVFLGVRKSGDRYHHTTVRGKDDVPRKCVVLGYVLKVGGACGFIPRNCDSTSVLVTIRLNHKVPLLDRVETAHVSCLEPVTKGGA